MQSTMNISQGSLCTKQKLQDPKLQKIQVDTEKQQYYFAQHMIE